MPPGKGPRNWGKAEDGVGRKLSGRNCCLVLGHERGGSLIPPRWECGNMGSGMRLAGRQPRATGTVAPPKPRNCCHDVNGKKEFDLGAVRGYEVEDD